jgi:hypothetical protein
MQQPVVGQGVIIIEASRSHSDTPQSVGLLWTSDQLHTKISTWQHYIHNTQTSMPQAGIDPAIPATEQPQPQP